MPEMERNGSFYMSETELPNANKPNGLNCTFTLSRLHKTYQ